MVTQPITHSIFFILFVSSIFYSVWTLFSSFPQAAKVASSLCIWIALILTVMKKWNMIMDFRRYKYVDFLVLMLCIITVIQIIRFFLFGGSANALSVFTNPSHLLGLLPPIVYYACKSQMAYYWIRKYSICLVIISAVFMHSDYCLLYVVPFLLYDFYGSNKQYLIIIVAIVGVMFVIRDGFIPSKEYEDTQRALLIVLFYSIICLAYFYLHFPKLFVWAVCMCSIIIPIALFCYSIMTGISIFSYMENIQDDNLNVDTRTFLYREILYDLSNGNDWLMGKGISNGYESTFFDNKNRNVVEVYFLQLLFRGGAIWLLTFMCTIIISIIYALKNSRNILCTSAAIMLSGFFFAGFVIDANGFKFFHVIIYFYIVMCTSKRWNQYSDKKIAELLKR